MKHSLHPQRLILAVLLLAALVSSVCAAEVRIGKDSIYCFSAGDFADPARGIYVDAVPSASTGTLCYGNRVLCAGDVLPVAALGEIEFRPACAEETDCALTYRAITDSGLGAAETLKLQLVSKKDTTPVCTDVQMETYKNIANTGALAASDEDGDALTYQIVRAPKRGSVELADDGSFTYTPAHNKVGRDSFVYTATDPAGNVSNEARVKIKIVKPTDAATFADLAGDPLEYRAMALKDMGVYGGRQIAGQLCFAPDETVSRGEFLVMAMRVLGMEPDAAVLTSGFADEAATAAWMRPYITAAYRSGVISGVSAETGMEFRPNAALTKAECAVMLQNMLDLPQPDTQPVFSVEEGECIASWAVPSASALQSAGLELTPENAQTFYTLHPRCGTSFLMFVMVVAIIVHAFMGWPNVWLRMATRLLVLPVIAGISYELLKWAGRSNNIIVEILSLPGLYLQKLTTKEPTLKQLEVAIASVKAVLNDGDDVPYFEGVCDLYGRPVEGEVRYYDPSKGDIKYEGPVGKEAEAAESAAQAADVSEAAPAENEVAKEEEA